MEKGADDLVLGVGGDLPGHDEQVPPTTTGTSWVAPKRHVDGLDKLSPQETAELMAAVQLAMDALKKTMNPDGFNVGLNLGRVAGAGIAEHMHFHIVPRWSGDVNFMTVLGEVRVVPEHIRATHQKLKPFFANMK